MVGTLYSHVSDSGQFLLVRRDRAFPGVRYKQNDWRVVAVGVEPVTAVAKSLMSTEGFYEYHVR